MASSIDGFIAGENDDISKFILYGEGVEKYHSDLLSFKTVIMGRKTYEFGYKFGLTPGQPVYPNMKHHIFSNNMILNSLSESIHIEKMHTEKVKEIKEKSEMDIYLCGGGEFAGWLLENNLIDQIKLKLNPIVLGKGIRLFGGKETFVNLNLTDKEFYGDGLQILTYELVKPALCIRNLLQQLINYHSVTCADFVAHHSGAMSA